MKTVLTSQAARMRTWLRATVLGTVAVLCGTVLAATPIPSGPLVTTDWLAQNLDNNKVRIIEVSVNPGLYERSHVPGAVNFSWHTDLNVGLGVWRVAVFCDLFVVALEALAGGVNTRQPGVGGEEFAKFCQAPLKSGA